ncbi:chaperone DnaJ-domain superfamily protein [Striga asiatica]|uniref:Chaperone DnaJ-domain superfamily protein n=1 Tax=Striga asiatica TaxID=4170 RepID=A0A5A7PXY6_STRAF|nr:chaperone DnaJ-domain superfamily protein [Striga asiatica]
MDEFGVLVESIGFKAHGKSAPMAKSKPKPESHFAAYSSANTPPFSDHSAFPVDELDVIFRSNLNIDKNRQSQDLLGDGDVFGANVSSSNQFGEIDLESVLSISNNGANDGNSNLRNSAGVDDHDDLFGSRPRQGGTVGDLLGDLGMNSSGKEERKGSELDELIPGYGGASHTNKRVQPKTAPSGSNDHSSNISSTLGDDPFLVFESSVTKSDASAGTSEQDTAKDPIQSSLEELDDFAMDRGQINSNSDEKMTTASQPSAGKASSGFQNVDDLDAFFGRAVQQHAAQTSTNQESHFDIFGGEKRPEGKQTSAGTNIEDNFTALFGDMTTSSEEFQEIEGEPEERRRARLNRHMRMNERMAEALAEKNKRDLQNQNEQEEKRRLAETLDNDIRCWAAGKEGNLRALLSSLQQVLWPECGWRPVSLTDMITSDSVKKVYKKATLYVHPDKVQQKGATLLQKYIAEKVFDLLKVLLETVLLMQSIFNQVKLKLRPGTNLVQRNFDNSGIWIAKSREPLLILSKLV